MAASIENEHFFPRSGERRAQHRVPAAAFFVRPAPPRDANPAQRLAATPLRFAATLFLVGWSGILFQAELLQQVVFGAPVFEEMAKAGLALLVAAVLRLRGVWLLVPLGWASGASFGVMEHFTTYAEEDVGSFALRIAFHAGSTGLSLAFFAALAPMPDVRARWAATALSTLLHWANNFGAVVLDFASLVAPIAETLALVVGILIAATSILVALVALAAPARFGASTRRALTVAMPRLGLDRQAW